MSAHMLGGIAPSESSRKAQIVYEVQDELDRATARFKPFNSAHEGYAVILEEMDELWEEIKGNKAQGAEARQRAEAIQVAAMAIRFILDVSDKPIPMPLHDQPQPYVHTGSDCIVHGSCIDCDACKAECECN